MKLSKKFEDAVRDPSTKALAVEMTDELKERLSGICSEMIDELIKRCKGPAEAYMVLHFMTETMEEMFNIRGAAIRETDDAKS